MKTIAEIKVEYAQTSISFIEQFNEEKKSTKWGKHWDNDRRISIIIPLDVHAQLADNPLEFRMLAREAKTYPKLFLELPANATPEQIAEREASSYTLVTLFTPNNVLGTY